MERKAIIKPYDPSKIKVNIHNKNLGFIIEMLEFEEINLMPDFQREGDLWNNTKKSQLIESILLGLPLPSFYFSEYKDSEKEDGNGNWTWAIVDGLQRLSTFQDFIINKDLALVGLEFLNSYEGKKYDDLSREDKRKISGFTINFYVIEKETPKDVKFLIFKRVNTGGLVLTPQEMRHALNQGTPAKFVKRLAEKTKEFKEATCYRIPSKRQEDRDFINRFIAFYLQGYDNKYYGELDSFLNDGMSSLSVKSKAELDKIELDFKKSMKLSYEIFGEDAFRKRYKKGERRKPISKAVYDTLSVNFAWLTDEERAVLKSRKGGFKKRLMELFNKKDEPFHKSITTATGQKSNVKTRFEAIKRIINETLNQ
ncbi:MAG: hypothetical protein B6I20_13095 [Bacteroidetes bacterium 4572_117]|nr:MAG: hypothetical protein B6I20_13095 [Bacteroidetes bacterium 4572_117]